MSLYNTYNRLAHNNRKNKYPVEVSQNLIVLSLEADAIWTPEGKNITDDTM
jgi:hypothetical protein